MTTPDAQISFCPDSRGVPILARSLFRQMREQGYSSEQIIGLSSQLLSLVHDDLVGASNLEASTRAETMAAE